jgi:hypothetical protein
MGENKIFVLQVHERGVGMVNVKPGDTVVKTESGFEVHPIVPFNQMFIKLAPILKVTDIPKYYEAIQFMGGPDNEKDITDWLNLSGLPSSFRHGDEDTAPYLRVELTDGSNDVPLNHWLVKTESEMLFFDTKEFTSRFLEVK